LFGLLKGLFYFLAFLLAYGAVPVLWYFPRMRVRSPGGTSYRLYLAGQCLALMGATGMVLPIIEIRDGEMHAVLLLVAGGIGGAAGLVVAGGWTREWERELRDKGRVESNIHGRVRYVYLALAALLIMEIHLERYYPPLQRLRIAALSSGLFFLLASGVVIWLWAAGMERSTSRAVQIFFRRA